MTIQQFNEYTKCLTREDYVVKILLKYDHESLYRHTNEILEYDYESDNFIWLNDWHEGEQDVIIAGIWAINDLKIPNTLIDIRGNDL